MNSVLSIKCPNCGYDMSLRFEIEYIKEEIAYLKAKSEEIKKLMEEVEENVRKSNL